MQNDPFGYYARKAQREAAIRAVAPYRIDDSAEVIPTYEELERRLESVGLGVILERRLMRPYDPVAVRNRAILAAMISLALVTLVAVNVACIASNPNTYQKGN